MADPWDLKNFQSKRNVFREQIEKGKKRIVYKREDPLLACDLIDTDDEVEKSILEILSPKFVMLPLISTHLANRVEKKIDKPTTREMIIHILRKLKKQNAIDMRIVSIGSDLGYEIHTADRKLLLNLLQGETFELFGDEFGSDDDFDYSYTKRKVNNDFDDDHKVKLQRGESTSSIEANKSPKKDDVMSLLSLPSTIEKRNKQMGDELHELLTQPSAKERSIAEMFKSQGGVRVKEFCPYGTKAECIKAQEAQEAATNKVPIKKKSPEKKRLSGLNDSFRTEEGDNVAEGQKPTGSKGTTIDKDGNDNSDYNLKCTKLHFKKIIQRHTDEALGDCSFLNTCFHMTSCKYVHYEVDSQPDTDTNKPADVESSLSLLNPACTLNAPQWIQCDLRYLDMTVLGKFAVVMADPPWDIHMELPYGTMSDDEMRQLGVPALQDDGLIFLWVTGRAMELGRECLQLWGYERVDEVIWVKTNQLQRIIRTGRTGHWLNHGKEHCLVGMKGNPKNLNRGLDCDVIVAEVRATSHKPDEIYGVIERLSPGTRKIELFGRPHNIQPNWITLGNQLDGIRLVDPELVTQFQKRYPDGNCMSPARASSATTRSLSAARSLSIAARTSTPPATHRPSPLSSAEFRSSISTPAARGSSSSSTSSLSTAARGSISSPKPSSVASPSMSPSLQATFAAPATKAPTLSTAALSASPSTPLSGNRTAMTSPTVRLPISSSVTRAPNPSSSTRPPTSSS